MFNPSLLPDITSHHLADIQASLQWVGMEEIAVPLILSNSSGMQQVPARASLYVNLDKDDAKGIHMSRLHLALNKQLAGAELSKENVAALFERMVASQGDISSCARLVLKFDLTIEKPALLSGELGFQSYPLVLDFKYLNGRWVSALELSIPYSSTCPCSASLSRQLYADAVNEHFQQETIDKQTLMHWIASEAGSVATPHSQRSFAYLNLTLAEDYFPDFEALIIEFEKAIGTPVQTAVKRADEQAFAKLNADNLMFCEDAARRIKRCLERMNFVSDYWYKVEHQESLHAHNAVVVDRKSSIKNRG